MIMKSKLKKIEKKKKKKDDVGKIRINRTSTTMGGSGKKKITGGFRVPSMGKEMTTKG